VATTTHSDFGLDGYLPLVTDENWRGLKDSLYNLMIHRAQQLPRMTFGDKEDRKLVRLLTDLKPAVESRQWLLGSVFDMGYDLGRHVYSKRVLHDKLPHALEVLAAEVRDSGLGELAASEVFHRSAELRLTSPVGQNDPAQQTIGFFVAGLILGTLEDVFNSPVEIMMRAATEFGVRLGTGRDVNQEVDQRA
jgi:hypothetical protein